MGDPGGAGCHDDHRCHVRRGFPRLGGPVLLGLHQSAERTATVGAGRTGDHPRRRVRHLCDGTVGSVAVEEDTPENTACEEDADDRRPGAPPRRLRAADARRDVVLARRRTHGASGRPVPLGVLEWGFELGDERAQMRRQTSGVGIVRRQPPVTRAAMAVLHPISP
jgi:hypothetical protein